MGQISAVEHQSLSPVLLCHPERLKIAPGSQLPGQGSMAQGESSLKGPWSIRRFTPCTRASTRGFVSA